MKKCTKCLEEKLLNQFQKDIRYKLGVKGICKACTNKWRNSRPRWKEPEGYRVWLSMKYRCESPASKGYVNYGGRGITYQPSWKSFKGFWKDMAVGYSPELTIERIDVNGNYCKENCKWATQKEQSVNKRNSVKYLFKGNLLTIPEISTLVKTPKSTLRCRIERGWSLEKAFS